VSACCAPGGDRGPGAQPPALSDVPQGSAVEHALVDIPGGRFPMGSTAEVSYPEDGEAPVHEVELSTFAIDAHAVTNEHFGAFVDATGYVTEAERFGWSFVFGGFLPDDFPETRAVAAAPWWRQVYEAAWRTPEGPQSDLAGRGDHPVVHVSWNDALAYCAWSDTRLPSEAEWEYAACGGRPGVAFPWGDELEPGGRHLMNVFQGTFPGDNTLGDGYAGTAPVGTFPPNGYGLHNMTGNVWEWCADWYHPAAYQHSGPRDPTGPPTGTHRVMRGGSYLCHDSYCRRYRVTARSGNTPDASTGNLGFRVARSV
jgi:formylglycine-generating enzyme